MFASAFSRGVGYAGQAGGFAANKFHIGAGYMGGNLTAMSAATGAVGGGIYGGTVGRDYGQSHLGGAFSGALGGAAMGAGIRGGIKYGKVGMAAGRASARADMKSLWSNRKAIGPNMGRSTIQRRARSAAGRGAWEAMSNDAMSAYSYIGQSLKGNGAFSFAQIGSTLKAGYSARR